MSDFKPKLRGNTFMILLLRAVKEEVSAKPTWIKQASGLTRATFFQDLIKVLVPSQRANNIRTLTKYIPEYLAGKRAYSRSCYPFNDAKFITKAKNRVKKQGTAALSAMKIFSETYLNMDHSNLEFLVGGIIDTALSDDSFNEILFTGEKWITKDLLEQETNYNLQAFLFSVWYQIMTKHNDAGEAKGAYEAWTDQSNMLTIKTTIGERFVDKIHVNVDDIEFIRPNEKILKISTAKRKSEQTNQKDRKKPTDVPIIETPKKSENPEVREEHKELHEDHVEERVVEEHIAIKDTENLKLNSDKVTAGNPENLSTPDTLEMPEKSENPEILEMPDALKTPDNVSLSFTSKVFNSAKDNSGGIKQSKIKPVIKNGYLTFDMNKRYLFSDCDVQDHDKQMNPPPERLMILSLYFITLEYNGEYYALLDYTSYVPGDSGDGYAVNKGMWSVPHTAVFVDVGRIKPTTIAEIEHEYKNFMDQQFYKDRMAKGQEDLLYNLGLLNSEAHNPVKGREYIEYKKSHTATNQMRCFYIREFFIHGINNTGILNLVDPEGLHQHFMVPVSLLRSMKPVNGVYYFMGKPMPNNVSDVFVKHIDLVNSLSCINKIQMTNMLTKVRGVLFLVIISDAATIYRELNDRYSAAVIEQIMPFIIEKCMSEFNVRYYSVDKSRVIGILPERSRDFTELFERLYEEITDVLIESDMCILLRCTVLSGEFLYGKILSPCDSKPSFIGEDLEKLFRMAAETRYIQWNDLGVCNGILLGCNERDDIHFADDMVRRITAISYQENNRNMKFSLLYKTDYINEKRTRYKSVPENNIVRNMLRRVSDFQKQKLDENVNEAH